MFNFLVFVLGTIGSLFMLDQAVITCIVLVSDLMQCLDVNDQQI